MKKPEIYVWSGIVYGFKLKTFSRKHLDMITKTFKFILNNS